MQALLACIGGECVPVGFAETWENVGASIQPETGVRVLTIDIECSPSVAHVWGLWDQNVAINQIVEDGRMICFAAKWYGDEQTLFYSENGKDGHEGMVRAAWELLNAADIVVTYNGISYDVKHLNREFVMLGLPPVERFKHVDLLRVVKKHFKFPSNKLDYVAQRLGIGHKVVHEGHGLWVSCMEGDTEAWQRMETYNRGDVTLTERLYDRLRPWCGVGMGVSLAVFHGGVLSCPACGGVERTSTGPVTVGVSRFDGYRCVQCGCVFRSQNRVGKPSASRLLAA